MCVYYFVLSEYSFIRILLFHLKAFLFIRASNQFLASSENSRLRPYRLQDKLLHKLIHNILQSQTISQLIVIVFIHRGERYEKWERTASVSVSKELVRLLLHASYFLRNMLGIILMVCFESMTDLIEQ